MGNSQVIDNDGRDPPRGSTCTHRAVHADKYVVSTDIAWDFTTTTLVGDLHLLELQIDTF